MIKVLKLYTNARFGHFEFDKVEVRETKNKYYVDDEARTHYM